MKQFSLQCIKTYHNQYLSFFSLSDHIVRIWNKLVSLCGGELLKLDQTYMSYSYQITFSN